MARLMPTGIDAVGELPITPADGVQQIPDAALPDVHRRLPLGGRQSDIEHRAGVLPEDVGTCQAAGLLDLSGRHELMRRRSDRLSRLPREAGARPARRE